MKNAMMLTAIVALAAALPAVARQGHQDHRDHGAGHTGHAGRGPTDAQAQGIVTSPADGAIVHRSPETFMVTFQHPMRLTRLTLASAERPPVNVPVAAAAATTRVVAPLPSLAPGNHVLRWVAVGQDGHEMSGAVRFMVH